MRLTITSASLLVVAGWVGLAAAQNPAPASAGQPTAGAAAGAVIGMRIQTAAAQPDTPGIGAYPAIHTKLAEARRIQLARAIDHEVEAVRCGLNICGVDARSMARSLASI